jgi:hypothetical protein
VSITSWGIGSSGGSQSSLPLARTVMDDTWPVALAPAPVGTLPWSVFGKRGNQGGGNWSVPPHLGVSLTRVLVCVSTAGSGSRPPADRLVSFLSVQVPLDAASLQSCRSDILSTLFATMPILLSANVLEGSPIGQSFAWVQVDLRDDPPSSSSSSQQWWPMIVAPLWPRSNATAPFWTMLRNTVRTVTNTATSSQEGRAYSKLVHARTAPSGPSALASLACVLSASLTQVPPSLFVLQRCNKVNRLTLNGNIPSSFPATLRSGRSSGGGEGRYEGLLPLEHINGDEPVSLSCEDSSTAEMTLTASCEPHVLDPVRSEFDLYDVYKEGYVWVSLMETSSSSLKLRDGISSSSLSGDPLISVSWGSVQTWTANRTGGNKLDILIAVAPVVVLQQQYTIGISIADELFACPSAVQVGAVRLTRVEPPTPYATREATSKVAASVAAVGGLLSGIPTVGFAVARANFAFQLSLCAFSDSEPLAVYDSPTGYALGSLDGAYLRGAVAGNTLIVFLFTTSAIVVGIGFQFVRRSVQRAKDHVANRKQKQQGGRREVRWQSKLVVGMRREWRDSDMRSLFGSAHCPGILVIPYAWLVQPTVAASVALLSIKEDSNVSAGLGLTECLGVAVLFGLWVTVRFGAVGKVRDVRFRKLLMEIVLEDVEREEAALERKRRSQSQTDPSGATPHDGFDASEGETKKKKKKNSRRAGRVGSWESLAQVHSYLLAFLYFLTEPNVYWRDQDPKRTFKTRFFEAFTQYRVGCHWFLVVELLLSLVCGVLQGLRPKELSGCQTIAIVLLVLSAVYLLVGVILRPYATWLDHMIFVVNGICTCLVSLLLVLFMKAQLEVNANDNNNSSSSSSNDAGANLASASDYVSVAQVYINVVFMGIWALQKFTVSMLRVRQNREEAQQQTNEHAGDPDDEFDLCERHHVRRGRKPTVDELRKEAALQQLLQSQSPSPQPPSENLRRLLEIICETPPVAASRAALDRTPSAQNSVKKKVASSSSYSPALPTASSSGASAVVVVGPTRTSTPSPARRRPPLQPQPPLSTSAHYVPSHRGRQVSPAPEQSPPPLGTAAASPRSRGPHNDWPQPQQQQQQQQQQQRRRRVGRSATPHGVIRPDGLL